MKEILAALKTALETLKSKANAALSGMQPLDQYEGAQEVHYAVRTLQYAEKQVQEMLESAAAVLEKYETQIAAEAKPFVEKEIEERIAASELVRKTDHELAIDNAKKEGEQNAINRIAAERQEELAAAARREEIVTKHGKEVADALPAEVFAAEAFNDTAKAEIDRRVSTLNELGVVAAEKPEPFKEIIACGAFTEEGKADFDKRITSLKAIIGDKPAVVAASAQRPVIPGSGTPPAAVSTQVKTPAASQPAVF